MKNAQILESKILEFFSHSPTSDQEDGINKLARFVVYDKKKVGLIIKGYAGTGKTTMISALVKAFIVVGCTARFSSGKSKLC